MIKILLIGAGGFFGVIARYLLSMLLARLHGGVFPLGTLLINFIGSFCIGMVFQITQNTQGANDAVMTAISIGLLGGFTTFSTFSLETVHLFEGGKIFMAALYMIVSVLVCVAAAWLGKTVMKAF